MARIAIEDSLQQVEEFLKGQGMEVVGIYTNAAKSADAFVITGLDQNLLGMQDSSSGIPIINARGMTPLDVYHQIQQSIPHR